MVRYLETLDAGDPARSLALVDEIVADWESRGAIVTQGIVEKPWGNREFRVADPAGNTIKFSESAA